MKEVVEKAQGVFLWVDLVTKLLLNDLTDSISMAGLRKRLKSLPPDLEGFYQHIIDTVDPFHRQWTSVCLKLSLSPKAPLPLITFSFVGEDPDFAFDEDFRSNETELPVTLASRNEIGRRRLDAYCKGLLEIRRDAPVPEHLDDMDWLREPKVDFLHRTVKEFLETSTGKDVISYRSPTDFDATIFLCKTLVATFRRYSGILSRDGPLLLLLKYALELEGTTHNSCLELFVLLDEAEKIYSNLTNHIRSEALGDLPKGCSGPQFLQRCAQLGLLDYVEWKLLGYAQRHDIAILLLLGLSAKPYGCSDSGLKEAEHDRTTQIVQRLLKNSGGRLNRACPSKHHAPFSWSFRTCCLIQMLEFRRMLNNLEVAKLDTQGTEAPLVHSILCEELVASGADLDAEVPVKMTDLEVSEMHRKLRPDLPDGATTKIDEKILGSLHAKTVHTYPTACIVLYYLIPNMKHLEARVRSRLFGTEDPMLSK